MNSRGDRKKCGSTRKPKYTADAGDGTRTLRCPREVIEQRSEGDSPAAVSWSPENWARFERSGGLGP